MELIDATPATATLDDAAVVIGRTFKDSHAGVHITPLARRRDGGTDPWIDVRINLDTGAPNMPVLPQGGDRPKNATPWPAGSFHATVADRDDNSFAYAWSFDDGTFSTNNQPLWAYKSWTTTGEHVVRCEVSDMRGRAGERQCHRRRRGCVRLPSAGWCWMKAGKRWRTFL